jgi:hypothetical protein
MIANKSYLWILYCWHYIFISSYDMLIIHFPVLMQDCNVFSDADRPWYLS